MLFFVYAHADFDNLAYLWRIYGVFMACTCQKDVVTLQQISKCITMNILGGIGLAVAIANYRKSKQEYNEALERVETLQSAVNTYTSRRDSQFDKFDDIAEDNGEIQLNKNVKLDGISVTTILYIGNLVGRNCNIRVGVVLTNFGSANIRITYVEAKTSVFGSSVIPLDNGGINGQKKICNELLPPGSTIEIMLPGSRDAYIEEEDAEKKLEKTICDSQGKKLITSCKKANYEDIETGDIRLKWKAATGAGIDKEAYYPNEKGVVRYCGEAFIPIR